MRPVSRADGFARRAPVAAGSRLGARSRPGYRALTPHAAPSVEETYYTACLTMPIEEF
ncbi:hypothetical protein [Streptomyces sp. NPDC006691]|uniref:hypothetical protein n=1 Tax=Streptomyces sp. NPDC006691 TaxID=3364757 RepID=UPI00368AD34A